MSKSCRNTVSAIGSMMILVAINAARAEPSAADVSPPVDAALSRGIAFLASQQGVDGSFPAGDKPAAVTGLALMAFLAGGNTPDVGPYGVNVRNAVDYLLKIAPHNGYFGAVDGSRMYGHGICTLALAEAYGAEADPGRRVKMMAALDKALDVILKAQDVRKDANYDGGWRYEPGSGDSDLSLSGWSALALRACQNIGMDVPKSRVERAVGFVLRTFDGGQGGFGYQPGNNINQTMTGVAVLNLYLMSGADRPELPRAGEYLRQHPVTPDIRFPYYAWYYTTQAAFQASGQTWDVVWKVTQEQLTGTQMQDGGWPQSKTAEEPGRVYATSMALLSLSVPQKLLPIYQR